MNKFFKLLNWRYATIALLLFGVALFWMLFSGRSCSVYRAVPTQTALTLEIQGFGQTFGNQVPGDLILEPISDLAFVKTATQFAGTAAALFRHHPEINEAFRGKTLLAAFSFQPADSMHALFILDTGRPVKIREITDGLQEAKRVFPAHYRGNPLFTIHLKNGQKLVAGAFRNLLFFSRYSYLVEDALAQLDGGDPWWTQNGTGKTTDPQPGAVCVTTRMETLAERLRANVLPPWKWLPDHLTQKIEGLRLFREPGNAWNVSVIRSDNTPLVFHPNRPAGAAFFSILPENTALLNHACLESAESISGFFNSQANPDDFETYIRPWLGGEFAWFITEPYSVGMAEDRFVVLSARDTTLARQYLERFGTAKGMLKNYDYQTFEVYQFLSPSLLQPFGNGLTEHLLNPVCVMLGNYTVWASNTSAIELLIDHYIVNQTLSNWPDFLQLQTKAGYSGGFLLYFNLAYVPMFLENIFGKNAHARVSKDLAAMAAPGLLGLNFAREGEKTITATTAFVASGTQASGASVLWKTALEAEAAGAPAIVRLAGEHPEPSEPAILIQDVNRQLYRFSEGGSVVWRKQLNQPILSAIHAIDFYKNGRLHYLFNTADAIWILDDEGREIEGFPLHLQSAATNGVLVVDFFHTRNYNLFVACANGNTYGFDQFGRPISGWNPRAGTGQVQFPMVHFRWKDKEYLATLSRDGKLSVFNQNGSPHFPPVQLEGRFTHTPPQFDDRLPAPRIVCLNNAGKAFVCNLEGKTFGMQMAENTREPVSMVLADFAGDDRKDFLLGRGKTLQLYAYEQKELKAKPSVSVPVSQDTLFYSGFRGMAGGINVEKRQIFLFEADGKTHPGFPLAGSTPFTMMNNKANRKEYFLIVGNGAALYAYKII